MYGSGFKIQRQVARINSLLGTRLRILDQPRVQTSGFRMQILAPGSSVPSASEAGGAGAAKRKTPRAVLALTWWKRKMGVEGFFWPTEATH